MINPYFQAILDSIPATVNMIAVGWLFFLLKDMRAHIKAQKHVIESMTSQSTQINNISATITRTFDINALENYVKIRMKEEADKLKTEHESSKQESFAFVMENFAQPAYLFSGFATIFLTDEAFNKAVSIANIGKTPELFTNYIRQLRDFARQLPSKTKQQPTDQPPSA